MWLTLVIFLAIIAQRIIYYKNRLISAGTGFLLTTGVLIYGIYLYNNTRFIIKLRSAELDESHFIILMMIWYLFDVIQLILALKKTKEKEPIIKAAEQMRSEKSQASEALHISASKEITAPPSQQVSFGRTLESFLGVENGNLSLPWMGIFLLAITAGDLIPRFHLDYFYYIGGETGCLHGPLFFVVTALSFILFSKKNVYAKVVIGSIVYGLSIIFLVYVYQYFYLKSFRMDIDLHRIAVKIFFVGIGKDSLLFYTSYAIIMLLTFQLLIQILKQPWIAAFAGYFLASTYEFVFKSLTLGSGNFGIDIFLSFYHTIVFTVFLFLGRKLITLRAKVRKEPLMIHS